MYFELATLTVRPGTVAQAVPAIPGFLEGAVAGRLLGCWTSDIGDLNQIVVLRHFETESDLSAERQRGLMSDDPFGCAAFATRLEMHGYRTFPFAEVPRPGKFGPIYEIRTYEVKVGGIAPTLEAWRAALPGRQTVSPCLAAMTALDGAPRITSIWPAASLEERARVRNDAVQQGLWPPKGGPAWLTSNMKSIVCLPTAISPLQ